MKKIKSFQKNKKFLCERTKNTGESWTCGSDGGKGTSRRRKSGRVIEVWAGTKRGEEGAGALKKCGLERSVEKKVQEP